MRLVITDSGLGGLSVCAALDATLRVSPAGVPLHITYFNVWRSSTGGSASNGGCLASCSGPRQ